MDIKAHLLKENSRKNWNEVISYIGTNNERFAILMDLFLNEEYRVVQRASQPIGTIAEKHPTMIAPYLPKLVNYLKTEPIDAVKRNVMRTFQFIIIPEEIEGDLFEIGMQFLKSSSEAVAIKAFSMTAVRRICEKYPELAQEVIFQIEILLKENVSKGLTSRGNSELTKLQKIIIAN